MNKRFLVYADALIDVGGSGRLVDIVCDLKSGLILDMGSGAYIRHWLRGRSYEVMDLKGRRVLPGFTDCHTHFVSWCLMQSRPDLSRAKTVDQCLKIIKRYINDTGRGEWITGTGWDRNLWPDNRLPHRKDLDRIAPHHPVALWSKDWHTLWLNSLALSQLGISKRAGSIRGGLIERDGQGLPCGILREEAANHYYQKIPPPSPGKIIQAIVRGQRHFHALGLTGFHTMEGPQEYGLLHRMEAAGMLRLRGVLYYRQQYLDELISLGMASGFGSQWLKIGGLKLFVDGSLGSQTAWLLAPYENSGHRGMAVISKEELTSLIRRASENRLACAIHAIGDAANRMALDVFQEEQRSKNIRRHELRHRLEHCQLVHPSDIGRFSSLGIIASVQPCHCPADLDLIEKHWGKRGSFAYPFGALLRAGARLALGTDAPIEAPDPWMNIQAAVTRQRIPPDRLPFYRREALTLQQAIKGYTSEAAYASGDEAWKGKLKPGMAADFICLEDDPYLMKPGELHKVKVALTVVAGRVVYPPTQKATGSVCG